MGRVLMDLSEWAAEEFTRRHKAIENAIYLIMYNKFGTLDTEGIKNCALKHNCALCYDTDGNFIGISRNNRWLYTPSGQTIGKKGKRWMIEKIDYEKDICNTSRISR